MKIGIIDYDQGNIKSLKNAINQITEYCEVISSPEKIELYDVLFLPGVGAYENAMNNLESKKLIEPIKKFVSKGNKLIGICLGMQLLFQKSFEFGEHEGLGLIEGEVIPFPKEPGLKIPHVGWNTVNGKKTFNEYFGDYYFVHSFYCKPQRKEDILFTTNYYFEFCSAIKRDNIIGLQFHPEKSQKNGLALLEKLINE